MGVISYFKKPKDSREHYSFNPFKNEDVNLWKPEFTMREENSIKLVVKRPFTPTQPSSIWKLDETIHFTAKIDGKVKGISQPFEVKLRLWEFPVSNIVFQLEDILSWILIP